MIKLPNKLILKKLSLVFNTRKPRKMKNFIDSAFEFKKKLGDASNFDSIRTLWLSTSLPYEINVKDPYSEEYRKSVEDIYEKLCECRYEVNNELTSTKQSADKFEIGYPWVSNNLEVIANHIAATTQAFSAISKYSAKGNSGTLNLIEFGAGWGNLAIPLARSGQNVTVVDIDDGFINRIVRIANREGFEVSTIHADFCGVKESLNGRRYNAAIFQSSFHHCLEFEKLLDIIREDVLIKDEGMIYFFAEPITDSLNFPWGLRYDGESLWAIMCNKWLELGFRLDFFYSLCLRKGFLLSVISGIDGYLGEGFVARNGQIEFNDWMLPAEFDNTWHPESRPGVAKFSKGISYLPSLSNCIFKHYELTIHNYSNSDMIIELNDANGVSYHDMVIGSEMTLKINADCDRVSIKGPQFIPHVLNGNGDERLLSFAASKVKLT